jgi:hypothetical protein
MHAWHEFWMTLCLWERRFVIHLLFIRALTYPLNKKPATNGAAAGYRPCSGQALSWPSRRLQLPTQPSSGLSPKELLDPC